MPSNLLRTGSLVLVLLGGTALRAGNAVAQQAPPAAEPQQQQQQEKAQQTPSGKMGADEPSSHAPSQKPADNSVFVNGALAVPGAANTDTVPAKFSAKNAADDKLITAAYTFKWLTEEQRRAIYQALKDQPAGSAFNADIGAELPRSVELLAMPDEVVNRVPQTKDYRYTVADNRVLLVGPVSRMVVAVFPDAKAIEAGEGRRAP
jgi:hypothetical protein